MAALVNLSFEDAGPTPGAAAGWTWTRSVSFSFATFAASSGATRFENFEHGWRLPALHAIDIDHPSNDTFADTLSPPGVTEAWVFGRTGPTPARFENFEREWRAPTTPPPDADNQGNETAALTWSNGNPALFVAGAFAFEDFEQGWRLPMTPPPDGAHPGNETYIWAITPSALAPAVFVGGAEIESFSRGWKGNEAYVFAFAPPALEAAPFVEWLTTQSFEDFSFPHPDLAVSFDVPTSTVVPLTWALPDMPVVGYYPPDIRATFYNTGVGKLPAEIDPRNTYFLIVGPFAFPFQISISVSDPPLVFTAGSGNNFMKSDPRLFWTLTDVGI